MAESPKKKCKYYFPAWLTVFRMKPLYRLVLCFAWLFLKLFYRLRVVGNDRFPEGACIIASNHISFLDPPIVAVSAPTAIHFLGRDTLFKNKFFGWFIRNMNCHPLKRDGSDVSAIRTIIQLLEKGERVLVFPQGTRSDSYEVGDLKGGIYLIASKANVKVVPAFVAGPLEIWPRNAKRPKLSGRVICLFGDAVEIDATLEPKEAQAQFLKTLKDSMNGLGKEAESLLRPR